VHEGHLQQRLKQASPNAKVAAHQERIERLQQRLNQALGQTLNQKQQRFAQTIEKLDLVSPLNILSRGYAIASKDKQVIRSCRDVSEGDDINIRVADGTLKCLVKETS